MKLSVFCLRDQYPQTPAEDAQSLSPLIAQAELAERLAFEALWLAEHHFQRLGTAPNPAVALAAIASRTCRLRVGPAVAVLGLREPIGVAEDYALLDQISGGRVNMGVGCGSQAMEFEGFGVDFETRRERFEAHLEQLRELWRGAQLNVVPVQRPAPPVFVATGTPDTARAAGRRGDGVLALVGPGTTSLASLSALLSAHAEGLADGGHAPDSAEVVVGVFAAIAEDAGTARSRAGAALERLLGALRVHDARGSELFDAMRAAGTGLFGTPADAAAQLAHLAEAGVRHTACLASFGALDAGATEQTLRALAAVRPPTRRRAPTAAAL